MILKGEPGLVLGSVLARQGKISLLLVIGTALVISFSVGQLYFVLARWKGRRWVQSTAIGMKYYEHTERVIRRYGWGILVISRFLYGIRNAIPLVCGLTKMKIVPFTIFNFVGAAFWAVLVGWLCWMWGDLVTEIFDEMETTIYLSYTVFFIVIPIVIFMKHYYQSGKFKT